MFLHPFDVGQQLKATARLREVRVEAGHVWEARKGAKLKGLNRSRQAGWSQRKEAIKD